MKIKIFCIIVALWACGSSGMVWAHCQVPCGIYDDQLRASQMAEDIRTIEKAMHQIAELSVQQTVNYNQLVRWINTKEMHAEKIMETVSSYFMAQRIKPDQKDYADKLSSLHQLMLSAMKSKQTTDTAHVAAMRSWLEKFKSLYFGKHPH